MSRFRDWILDNFECRPVQGKDAVQINCPFCGDVKHHMRANLDRESLKCFRCGRFVFADVFMREHGATATREIRLPEGETLEDTVSALLFQKDSVVPLLPVSLPSGCHLLYQGSGILATRARQYWERRVFDPRKKAEQYQVCYCSEGLFADRLILPVYSASGQLIYFQARALFYGMEPKYLNPVVQFHGHLGKSGVIFNLPVAVRCDYLTVVEGYFDALRLWPAGVALFGKEISEAQLMLLSTAARKAKWKFIRIMLDADAHRFSLALAQKLSAVLLDAVPVYVHLLRVGDPGSLSLEQTRNLASDDQKFSFLSALRP